MCSARYIFKKIDSKRKTGKNMTNKTDFHSKSHPTTSKQSLEALSAIKKKLLGKKLTYQEIFSLMDEVVHQRLGPILTTYFVAAGFKEGFSSEELYHLTRAMVA